jgi:ComF family protein
LAAVPYESPWNALITSFKFQSQPGLAFFLAQTMQMNPCIAKLVSDADHVIPVPLSSQRLRERGFNQALQLAKHLAPPCVLASGLVRFRDTTAQSGLTRQERLHNLTHAFIVAPQYVSVLRQSRVVLVDDVMTTGATLHACTQVLLAAGIARVDVVALARTSV